MTNLTRVHAKRRDLAEIMATHFSAPFTTHDESTISIVGHATKSVTYVGGEAVVSIAHSYDAVVTTKYGVTTTHTGFNFRTIRQFLHAYI